MISKIVKYFCCEDISLIENYKNAVEDETQIWDCHHRREITENKTIKELKNENLYYHRPANELIFLTHSEHVSLHTKGVSRPMREETKKKISAYQKCRKRKPLSEETKRKIGVATGIEVGYGADNEPLLKDVKIVKELPFDYFKQKVIPNKKIKE